MYKLLPVFLASLVLAALANANSVYDLQKENYIKKDRFWFVVLAVVLSLFVGLRTKCNDTGAYRHGYELLDVNDSITTGIDWFAIGDNPGFIFTNNVLKHLGFSTQSFLMFYAVITICIYIWFIRKYTNNIWLSIFFFWTMGVYTFTLAAIKQCVAVAFCLLATDCAIEKKWIRFVVWVLLAATFHPYALMYLAVPFLMFTPWTGKTYIMVAVFGVIGVSLQALLGSLISITTMLGEEYTVSSFSGEGVNVFRLLVVMVPLVLSFISREYIHKYSDRVSNLMINLSMLNAEIMFVARFGTANYFARLANYFLIFQVIALPWIFNCFNRESKRLLTVGAVVGFLIYFYYANGLYGGFDANYARITIGEYLRSIF